VAYALAWVDVAAAVDGQIRLGSNDSVVLWVGGRKLHDRLVERGAKLDDDVIPVSLPAGRTPILLKIGQSALDWGFYFRIIDAAGRPLSGVHVTTQSQR